MIRRRVIVRRRLVGPAALSLLAALVAAVTLSGCGLKVQLQDLFLLTRTGQGTTLRLVVNDGGTMRCNGGSAKTISSALLIQARDLTDNLAGDATKHLTIARTAGTVYYFTITLQQGTVSFPDRLGQTHTTLSEAELFATQSAQQVCHLPG